MVALARGAGIGADQDSGDPGRGSVGARAGPPPVIVEAAVSAFFGDIGRAWCAVGAAVALGSLRRPLSTFLRSGRLAQSQKAALFVIVVGALLFFMAAGGFIPAVRRWGLLDRGVEDAAYEAVMALLWAGAGVSVWTASVLLAARRWFLIGAAGLNAVAMYFAVAGASVGLT